MNNFKGTKGNWVFDDESIYSLDKTESKVVQFIVNNPEPYSETRENVWIPNALIISKAPKMLEMLEEIIKTQLLYGSTIESKIEKLIKEATEL